MTAMRNRSRVRIAKDAAAPEGAENRLTDIATHEVSIVPAGANKRVFLVVKSKAGAAPSPTAAPAAPATPAVEPAAPVSKDEPAAEPAPAPTPDPASAPAPAPADAPAGPSIEEAIKDLEKAATDVVAKADVVSKAKGLTDHMAKVKSVLKLISDVIKAFGDEEDMGGDKKPADDEETAKALEAMKADLAKSNLRIEELAKAAKAATDEATASRAEVAKLSRTIAAPASSGAGTPAPATPSAAWPRDMGKPRGK